MKLIKALKGKLMGRPLAMCDIGDVDGIASAALFKRKYPNGVVILMGPNDVKKWWVRLITWDFVADLPCPGKAKIRADHHKTNKPCAKEEFYDPEAPASAVLAAKALGLEEDYVAKELVEAAVQTDMANVTDPKIRLLDLAIRYAKDGERYIAVELLAARGLAALEEEPLKSMSQRGVERDELVKKIAESIPPTERLFIYSPVRLGISYRALVIELEKKGAKFVNILVRRGLRTFRLYCGAHRDSAYDCTAVAAKLGGGGHKYASGALAKGPITDPTRPLKTLIDLLKPEVVYSLGDCRDINTHCVSIQVMNRGSGDV